MSTTVYVDLDGTLVTFDRPYPALVEGALDPHLGDTDAAVSAYLDSFPEAFRSLSSEPYMTGMEAAVEATDAAVDPSRLVAALHEAELDAATVPSGARSLLDSLEDHRIGVLTDGVGDWQRSKLEAVGLAGELEAVVVSYEVGAHKPDPAVFEAARRRLPADTHVMIGDDREADVEGARAAGFEAVHVDPDAGDVVTGDLGAVAGLIGALT